MNNTQQVECDRRQAFTLVELLVVIAILGMLAGLTSAAVYRAVVRSKIQVVSLELTQLDQAAGQLAQQHGLYPPDFTGSPAEVDRAVQRYLQKVFTQYDATNWRADMAAAGIQATDPASALLVFLGGIPEPVGDRMAIMTGFSTNPRNPFDTSTTSRSKPLFSFDPKHTFYDPATGTLRYWPSHAVGDRQRGPIVYFRAEASGSYAGKSFDGARPLEDVELSTPARTRWANPDSCQIRASGFDLTHGTGVAFPTGTDYDDAQWDDITNITSGTLGDKHDD